MSANSSVQISMVANAVETETKTTDAIKLLSAIKLGKWRKKIAGIHRTSERSLRETGELQKAKRAIDKQKKRLPGSLWSGLFSVRADEKLEKYSALVCADVDSLGDRLSEVREKLSGSP